MKYTIYKITNTINNKIYIGVHKTEDINDGYMGSGVYLKRAQEKYGIENFIKEILAVFDNPEDMFEMESILVNEEFVKREDTYNLKVGGFGGFDHLNDGSEEHINRCQKGGTARAVAFHIERYANPDLDSKWRESISQSCKGRKHSEETKQKISQSSLGRKHSIDSKRKIGEANSKHQKGKGNSQYGTMWITNGVENKKIKKEEPIPEGWRKGRVL